MVTFPPSIPRAPFMSQRNEFFLADVSSSISIYMTILYHSSFSWVLFFKTTNKKRRISPPLLSLFLKHSVANNRMNYCSPFWIIRDVFVSDEEIGINIHDKHHVTISLFYVPTTRILTKIGKKTLLDDQSLRVNGDVVHAQIINYLAYNVNNYLIKFE